MADDDKLERIAAAMHAMRPDWPTKSLVTFLRKHHADRATADLAVAAIAVAVDERTTTPNLLNQHGPWWVAAYQASRATTPTVGPGSEPRCTKPGHEHLAARNCHNCRADALAGEDH